VTATLAICIATYNRVEEIDRLLGELAEAIAACGERVPILVSDNASPDETAEVLARWVERMPDLTIHRQPENLGPRRNIAWLIEHAPERDYVWVIGDDDSVVPGGLSYVLELLRRERPDWLHLPHRFIARGSSGPGNCSPCPEEVERFDGSAALYLRYHHWTTFMSAMVVRREPLQAVVRASTTQSAYHPLVWSFLAGLDGPCVVADRRLVDGGPEISWSDMASIYLTEHYTGLFDEGLGLRITAEQFGAALDGLYGDDHTFTHWQSRPIETLARVVGRFPHSRKLRWFLFRLARDQGRTDMFAPIAAACEAAGAVAEAERLVDEGEALFASGDAVAALDAFERAVLDCPSLPRAWNDLAVARHALGRYGSLGAVGIALELDPGYEDALINRSELGQAAA
jgi:glycosyltransferase involved in cell wall biosynthesis